MLKEGAAIIGGNSELLNGPLGNCLIGFDGYMLGLTTDDTAMASDDDVKEILYSQEGTKASDHVITGQLAMLTCTFGEIKTNLLKRLKHGFTSEAAEDGTGDDSGTFSRYLYTSLRDNKAKALRVYATDENGIARLDEENVFQYYEAVPIISDTLLNWGADTQRNVQVQFMIYFHKFGTDQVAGGPPGAFGFFGLAATEKVPDTTWPDVAAPILVTAEATAATTLVLTFNENIADQATSVVGGIVADVDGVFSSPTSIAVPVGAVSTLTFAAASFTAGDVIKINISSIMYEDTETTANIYPGIAGFGVTNSVP